MISVVKKNVFLWYTLWEGLKFSICKFLKMEGTLMQMSGFSAGAFWPWFLLAVELAVESSLWEHLFSFVSFKSHSGKNAWLFQKRRRRDRSTCPNAFRFGSPPKMAYGMFIARVGLLHHSATESDTIQHLGKQHSPAIVHRPWHVLSINKIHRQENYTKAREQS